MPVPEYRFLPLRNGVTLHSKKKKKYFRAPILVFTNRGLHSVPGRTK